MFGVYVVYLGYISGFLAAASLLKPLSFLGIRTRRSAALVLLLSFILVGVGWMLPSREVRIDPPRTQLDQFAPIYQFNEVHSIRIQAPKERVYQAIKSVTADEILFFRTLTWIRRFGQSGPKSIMNAPGHEPLLDVATKTSFILLAEEPNREIVFGGLAVSPRGWRPPAPPTPGGFKAFREPGFALTAMNFLIEDAGNGASRLTTETRVYATDDSTRRLFAAYWRTIYPGSALIRRMWLRAIARRGESTG